MQAIDGSRIPPRLIEEFVKGEMPVTAGPHIIVTSPTASLSNALNALRNPYGQRKRGTVHMLTRTRQFISC